LATVYHGKGDGGELDPLRSSNMERHMKRNRRERVVSLIVSFYYGREMQPSEME
jgi:hypothetical protein